MTKIGIIGGSGLDNPELLENYQEKEIKTPYGNPSSKLTCGEIQGIQICILARHGKQHTIPPSQINFKANISALKQEGCNFILATSAVGSLRKEIKPGDLVFPDQFIDFTKQRKTTFFSKNEKVIHTSMSEPYSKELRETLIENCKELNLDHHEKANLIVIEGPRFSTKAESHMFRNWGADIIGMTGTPEVILANELKIPYATIAMSTDYDCWKEDEEAVTFEIVLQRMKENANKVKQLLLKTIPKIASINSNFIKNTIRTIPNFPKQGIQFRDITTLLSNPEAMEKTINILYNRYKNKNINIIAGIESRGFIFGSMLADKLKLPFIPIRKPGKLPSETITQEYELEYGTDKIEIHKDAIKPGQKVLVVDDLIATGGTCVAACNLVEKLGGLVDECAFVVELADLGGREKMSRWKVFSVVEFEESE